MKKSVWGFIVVLFLIIAVSIYYQGANGHPADPSRSGSTSSGYARAPLFSLEGLDGRLVHLEDFRGKVVLINFWATWCPPCRHELPDIVRLREELKGKGFEVIGIILESRDARVENTVRQMQQSYGIHYPLVWGTNQVVMDYGNISAIPTTFVINKKGEIVQSFVGARDYQTFRKEVEKWLSETEL